MSIPKFTVRKTAYLSVVLFFFHLSTLSTVVLKLRFWDIYQRYTDALDLVFFGLYCFSFIACLAVWSLADAPLSRRLACSGTLFVPYFIVSLVLCIIVTRGYMASVF